MVELGATPLADGQTRFRVWAPDRRRIEVCLERGPQLEYLPLARAAGGYCECVLNVPAGARYKLRIDGGDCFPDPCSRWQPDGPHGPSVVVEPRRFTWLLSSEEARFGGGGACAPDGLGGWTLPGQCALVMRSAPIFNTRGNGEEDT